MTKVIAVCGPTAAGKTEYAIEIALSLNGEIISCDSMQLYKYMDIGSAKPSSDELSTVPHHLIGVVDPREKFSAAKYKELALAAVHDIASRGKIPVIAGGTGLYLDSLIYDMDFAAEPPVDASYRKELYEIAESEGAHALHELLKREDPVSASRIHENNVKRVVRALEAVRCGSSIADFSNDLKPSKDIEPILVGLKRDRQELYDRINRRVDIMIEHGLEDEVRYLSSLGLTKDDISMKGIGYKEIFDYIEGICTLGEAAEAIKKNTRHYAKRQMTWLKRYDDMKWFTLDEKTDVQSKVGEIISWLQKKL